MRNKDYLGRRFVRPSSTTSNTTGTFFPEVNILSGNLNFVSQRSKLESVGKEMIDELEFKNSDFIKKLKLIYRGRTPHDGALSSQPSLIPQKILSAHRRYIMNMLYPGRTT